MKRLYGVIFALVGLFVLSGCNVVFGSEAAVLEVLTEEFDMDAAYEMILELETPVFEIQKRDSISRSEYQQLREQYVLFASDVDILSTFFDRAYLEDESIQEFIFDKKYWYPTLLDEGIIITRAYIETTIYEKDEQLEPLVFLHIEQGYTGSEQRYQEWERGYLFLPGEQEGWKFEQFSGRVNMPLAEDAPW